MMSPAQPYSWPAPYMYNPMMYPNVANIHPSMLPYMMMPQQPQYNPSNPNMYQFYNNS